MKKHLLVLLISFSLPLVKSANGFAQNIAVNTSGATNSTLSMFEVLQTSTTASTKGLHVGHSGGIAGTGYGLWSEKTGASTTNIGGYFSASGATNNYPGIFMGGNVGIGSATPLSKMHIAGGGIALGNDVNNSISSTEGGRRSIQLSSDLSYGGTYNDHTGILMFTTMPGGWTTAKLHIRNSTNWGTYSAADAMTINESTVYIAGSVGLGVTSPAYGLDLGTKTFGFGASGSRTEYRNDAGLMGSTSQSGFYQTAAPSPSTDWPVSTANYTAGFDASGNAQSWWHLIDCRHSNTGNNYALQISGSFFDQKLYFRKTNGSATTAWTEVLTTSSSGIATPRSQVFLTNGTFNVTAGTSVMVTMCGGGGGGGGGGSGGTTQNSGGGGGGGAECYNSFLIAVTNTETWTITVGAAGTAGALNTNGGNGGTTSIVGSVSGTILTASGGSGGTRGFTNSTNNGASGGAGGNGGGGGAGSGGSGGGWNGASWDAPSAGGSVTPSCNYSPGAGGGGGYYNNNYGNQGASGGNVPPKLGGTSGYFYYGGGCGGASLFGAGGVGAGSNNAGYVATAGSGYGAGGGGGCGHAGAYGGTTKVGAAGSPGIVTIYY